MHAVVTATIQADPAPVWDVVADLATWPRWLDVVTRAVPDGDGAWRARLGLRVGPLDLGYDVRMVLVEAARPGRLRFERVEADGQDDHSAVVLDVTLARTGEATVITLEATVDKRIPLLDLDRELRRRASRSVARLEEVVRTTPR